MKTVNDPSRDPLTRPGITRDTLVDAGIRYVDAEHAKTAIGYEAPGLAIPYWTLCGKPLEIKGRHFHRVRLDKPKGSAKYLSPKASGAQLYIPKSHTARAILYLTEGEFKALSLCEAEFFAVGLGGITSAMHEGKLLPRLSEIIKKKAVTTVAFIGDADTALIYDFAREAVKIRKALPPDVRLILPRVPFSGRKGIDDIREDMGAEFAAFMEQITADAIEVSGRITPGSLALKLLLPVMAEVAAEYDQHESRLLKLAKCLDPVSLDRLAKSVKEHIGIGIVAFRKAVDAFSFQGESVEKELPKLFFDGDKYFRASLDKLSFESIIRADAFLEIKHLGFSDRQNDDGLSSAEKAIHKIQTEGRVHYAGPLCGRPTGLHKEGDIQILATHGPRMIEGKEGDPTAINMFLAGLFGHGVNPFFREQMIFFVGWLKHFRQALRRYDQHLPGQALALVGDRDSGKSLFQTLITLMSGGRAADASLCLLGRSDFNSELWKAEHLFLDDDKLGDTGKESHAVRDRLKKITVANLYNLHGKNRDAVGFRPIWRTTISANMDDESVNVLPPPDDSFGDKISYLKCYPPAEPFHDGTDEGRAAFWQSLVDAIPAFLYKVDTLEPSEEFRSSRFFVREFHHPDILEAIFANAQESPLAEFIDEWIEADGTQEGTASELLRDLTEWSDISRVRMFTQSVRHFGFQLGRIAKLPHWKGRINKDPVRIGGRTVNRKVNSWQILPQNPSAD